MSTLAYRSDIDGLRAIAVLAVVLYHYGIGPLQGGFVGVDIFFVISGYLITGIIHKEISRGDFTFAGFYERRIRRIFPALFAVLLATLAVGAWLLLPSDLVRLGNATLATLLFGSNVLFWRQSGYFDTSSEYNPLLHTWSLAVEEQFYIGLPILLILLNRSAKGWLKPALIICTIASFAVCAWVQALRPTVTFFLSPFRAWELLLGGWLAVGSVPPMRSARTRLLVSAAALTLLLFSLSWIKAGPEFPGWRAALPVVSTAALLHAGAHGDSPVKRLLSWRLLAFVGLVSYSLYLWHWPLIVFVRYRDGMEPLPPGAAWLLLVVAVVLAAASYRWIETPMRQRKPQGHPNASRSRVFAAAAVACLLLAGSALAVRLEGGWQARFTPAVVALDSERSPVIPFVGCQQRLPFSTVQNCVAGDPQSHRRILLWGDSYAMAWAPAFDALGKQHGFAVDLALLSSCPPLVGIAVSSSSSCQAFNEKIASALSAHAAGNPATVVLIGSWGPYLDPNGGIQLDGLSAEQAKAAAFVSGLHKSISTIVASGARAVVIGPTPGAPSDIPYRLAAAGAFGLPAPKGKAVADSKAYDARFWNIADAYGPLDAIAFVDPRPWFMAAGRYRYATEDGQLLYRDGGHLSMAGAAFVAERFPIQILFDQGPDLATLAGALH